MGIGRRINKMGLGLIGAGILVGAQYMTDGQIPGCRIKGNISQSSGERIYHLPSQDYYDETVINASKGERWFCSESEARSAGWRKSKV